MGRTKKVTDTREIKHIGADNLKALITKANEAEIDPNDFLQILVDKGQYFLIYNG